MLTEAVINLVDIHDRLVTFTTFTAPYLTGRYYTSSSSGLSILPCLFPGNKKIKTWKEFRVVTAHVLKFRVVSRPPCPRLAARLPTSKLFEYTYRLHIADSIYHPRILTSYSGSETNTRFVKQYQHYTETTRTRFVVGLYM